MQTNWIGESKGLEFAFKAVNAPDRFDKIEVYTTRPDTLMGASFVGISADHPLARELEKVNPDIASFNAQCRQMSTSEAEMEKAEKKGIDTGILVTHPLNPDINLPVWIANFVQEFNIRYGEMAAGSFFAMIPALILVIFAQKHIIKGGTDGAVKG